MKAVQIKARHDARHLGKMTIEGEVEDSYNMEAMLMLLHEFIHHPWLMISSLLLYLKYYPTAEESIAYYN